jgi:hypothetical protein
LTQFDRAELNDEDAEASVIAEYEVRIAALERRSASSRWSGPLPKNAAPADRGRQREILHRHRPKACSVRRGREVIELPRNTFYYRITIKTTKLLDAKLVTLIEDIQDELPCYGYRRATPELRRRGHLVNHKRVAHVMRTAGLGINTGSPCLEVRPEADNGGVAGPDITSGALFP